MQLLEGAIFIWYATLSKNSIVNWELLEHEFLIHCSTHRRVRFSELIETKQKESENITDFIARWIVPIKVLAAKVSLHVPQ